jgi:hypothetical protein
MKQTLEQYLAAHRDMGELLMGSWFLRGRFTSIEDRSVKMDICWAAVPRDYPVDGGNMNQGGVRVVFMQNQPAFIATPVGVSSWDPATIHYLRMAGFVDDFRNCRPLSAHEKMEHRRAHGGRSR